MPIHHRKRWSLETAEVAGCVGVWDPRWRGLIVQKVGRTHALLTRDVSVFRRQHFRGALGQSGLGLPTAGGVGKPVATRNILRGRTGALSRRASRIGSVAGHLDPLLSASSRACEPKRSSEHSTTVVRVRPKKVLSATKEGTRVVPPKKVLE